MRPGRAVLAAAAGACALAAALWAGVVPLPQPRLAPELALPDLHPQLARARAFSSEPTLQLAPRFSHDGRHVAFALGEGASSRIVVQAVDGSSRQFIGGPGALRLSPVFFPDGRRIAFWKASGGDCAIVAYDLRTASESPLVDCALLPRVRFDVSPDGMQIVLTGTADARAAAGLWIVDVATGARRALTTPGAGLGDDLHPRFSPDGRFVAFFRGHDARRQPWAVRVADPESARALTHRTGSANGLAWLGVRGPLLVASDWDGAAGLQLLDAQTGRTRALRAQGARFPDVSAAGDVVYERVRGEAARRDGLVEAGNARPAAGTSPAAIDLMMARVK